MKTLILSLDKQRKIVNTKKSLNSNEYAKLYKKFAKRCKKPTRWMDVECFELDKNYKVDNVYFNDSLGCDGSYFTLFKLPNNTETDIKAAAKTLYNSRDVSSIRIIRNIKVA